MINFRKCKKLCVALSLSLLSFSFSNASEKFDVNKINNSKYKILMGAGLEGKVYRCSPFYVLKEYEEEQNTDLLKKLEGKDLGDNLMNVVKVYDDKHILFEHISGKTYDNLMKCDIDTETFKTVCTHYGLGDITLSINYFIDKWVIGTIEGMEKIHKLTGRYLGDRNVRNFIVKNYGKIDPVLVLIDYDFLEEEEIPSLGIFVEIFLGIMEKNVDQCNKKKWTLLHKYLQAIENETFENANVILHELTRIRNSK